MNMISIGSFDGYEAPVAPVADSESNDAKGFDEILDSIAGLMQTVPNPLPPAAPVAVTPKGWNPDIEKLKATFGIDNGPTAVNPANPDLPPVVAPILVNPHAKVETTTGRQPPRLPDIKPTPDIIVLPGKNPGKEPPVVGTTPGKIILPKIDPTKKPPVVAQTPDIIVVPPKDVKPTPDIIVVPQGPVKQPPKTPPVAQTPDIIVLPGKQPPVKVPNNGQTPDIIVLPTKEPPVKLPNDGRTPVVPPVKVPTRPPMPTIQDRKSDPLRSQDIELPISVGEIEPVNPIDENPEVFIEPTGVREGGSGFDNPNQTFDPGRVRIYPRLDSGRLKGFGVTPDTVEAIVQAFNPTAAPKNTVQFTQQSSETTPRLNIVTKTINASMTPEKANDAAGAANLSRFWLTSDAPRPTTPSPVKETELQFESPAPAPKPVETRVSGDAAAPPRPTLFGKLTTDIKAVTEPTLVKTKADRVDDAVAKETTINDEGAQPLKFERIMANAANDVSKPAETKTEPAAAQVADQVNPHLLELAAMANRKQEKQTLKLRLHPAELGSVEIRLERTSGGAMNAFFTTETDGARQALTQNMDQLRESLRQSGWQVGQMEVANGGPSDGGGRQQGQSQPRGSQVFNDFFTSTVTEPSVGDDRNSPNRLLSLLA